MIRAYGAKRDFAVTAEPPAASRESRSEAPIFVIQKHAARRAGLHWDFRLEHDGVLWSWAVRKGPSLDPADKRLAAHVEDHPLDYAGFQGTIPEGQYGAGSVEAWDHGTWSRSATRAGHAQGRRPLRPCPGHRSGGRGLHSPRTVGAGAEGPV